MESFSVKEKIRYLRFASTGFKYTNNSQALLRANAAIHNIV